VDALPVVLPLRPELGELVPRPFVDVEPFIDVELLGLTV